jgi:hypothetical protein
MACKTLLEIIFLLIQGVVVKRAKLLASAIPVLMMSGMPAAHAGGLCDIPFLARFIPQCQQQERGYEGSGSVSVPEPATLALLSLGFGGVGFAAWRRRRKAD